MFILFDTNVWISQLGLQSQYGAAVRYFARKQNATVVVPEIVQLEVEEKLTARMLEWKRKIEDGHRNLLPVLGRLVSIDLPSDEKIRKSVKNIIPNFDVPTRLLQFNEDVARSSMIKMLRRIPPSAKSEQFRDGVIWAHCMDLLDEDDVFLVSEDKDFYSQRDYAHGLATELKAEISQSGKKRQVELKSDLEQLLDEIRVPVVFNLMEIYKSICEKESDAVNEILSSNGFELFGCVESDVACFATEDARRVFITFSFVNPCQDRTGTGRRPGKLTLKGSVFLDPQTSQTHEVQLSKIGLDYPDWKPDGPSRGTVFLSAHFNAPKLHRIRFPLYFP